LLDSLLQEKISQVNLEIRKPKKILKLYFCKLMIGSICLETISFRETLSVMDNQVEIKKVEPQPSSNILRPGFQCPPFYNTQALMEDGVTKKLLSINDFKKNYVVLIFFPMDSSVDHSELMAYKENMENFVENDCQVVGVTSESLVTIENLITLEPNQGGTGGPVNFPIISDKTMEVAKMFGVSSASGMLQRATFILNKKRIIRQSSVHDRVVRRSVVDKVLRIVKGMKEIDQDIMRDNAMKLCVSILAGKKEVVKRILGGCDVDINSGADCVNTPLIYAIRRHARFGGYLDIVRRLLEHEGIQLGKMSHDNMTALHWACYKGSISVVQLLCQHSRCSPAVVNKKTRGGETALMMAVSQGHLEIVRELDMEGTDFFTTDRRGRSLMAMARMRNNADVLQYLVERKKVDSLKAIVAHYVARYIQNKADVESLGIPETLEKYLARFVDADE